MQVYVDSGRQVRLLGIPLTYQVAYILGVIALILALVLFYVQNRESRQQLIEAEQRKQKPTNRTVVTRMRSCGCSTNWAIWPKAI